MITFGEKSTLSVGWGLEVLKDAILVGFVRKNPSSGLFQYFDGIRNTLTPNLQDNDLKRLKKRIMATLT